MVNSMKYIEKVILNNFQSHKNTTIEFDNRLNVIVGPSDSGKTAILRGIRWALYNEPSGDYFIREGETECSVTIIFSDGIKVKRYRSKSKNAYYLYDNNGEELVFEGFGLSVPEEIIEKTGIKKILLDSDLSKSINLSDQLEGPFLLSERGSTRASSIGRLVGVNIIDDALREALRDSRQLSQNKRNIDENIEKLEKDLLEYDYLTELSIKISNLEKVKDEIKDKSKALSKYKELFARLKPLSTEKDELIYFIEKFKGIDLLDIMVKDITINLNQYRYLTKQKKTITALSKDIDENKRTIKLLKDLHIIEDNISDINHLYSLQSNLNKLGLQFKNNKKEIYQLNKESIEFKDIKLLEEKIKNINIKTTKLYKLDLINNKYNITKGNIKTGNLYIKKLLEVDNISSNLEGLEFKINSLFKLKSILEKYESNSKDMKEHQELLKLQNFKVGKLLKDYKNLLLKLGSCPLCYSIIDQDKANHIINQYN